MFALQLSLPGLFEASRGGRLRLDEYDAAMVVAKHAQTRVQLRRPLQ